MQSKSFLVGQVVQSIAGRDGEKFFLLYKLIDDDFCLIVDGRTHKLAKPKKKRLKHLRPVDAIAGAIAEKWYGSQFVFDSEIASSLKAYNMPDKPEGETKPYAEKR